MYAKIILSLFVGPGLLLSLSACDPPKPEPTSICYVISATEQIPQDTPPTLVLQRSFTYANSQLTAMTERSAKQQATYQLEYQSGKVIRATGTDLTLTVERDAASGRINRATTTKAGQTQSVFTLTYTASGRLSTLTEDRQVVPINTGFSGTSRTYSFSYTGENVTTERVKYTYKDGSSVDQEITYTVGDHPSAYASFPETALLTIVSLAAQFETMPGRLWQTNALTGYQTYTINGSNRLLAESAKFADTYDASGNLAARAQTTSIYIPAGSSSFVTKPTAHTFAYECR